MTASIKLIQQGHKTIVRITEDGRITNKEFMTLAFAQSWAAGQAIRLDLPVQPVQREAAE